MVEKNVCWQRKRITLLVQRNKRGERNRKVRQASEQTLHSFTLDN